MWTKRDPGNYHGNVILHTVLSRVVGSGPNQFPLTTNPNHASLVTDPLHPQ